MDGSLVLMKNLPVHKHSPAFVPRQCEGLYFYQLLVLNVWFSSGKVCAHYFHMLHLYFVFYTEVIVCESN